MKTSKTHFVSMTRKEIADDFGVSVRTLNRWLFLFRNELNLKPKQKYFSPQQVSIIYMHLDALDKVNKTMKKQHKKFKNKHSKTRED